MPDNGSTIEEIEGTREPDPGPDATALVRRCLTLRRKPLPEFTVEDLRIMIGQQLSLPILLPLAVTVLAGNPLAAGDYYPGDLLRAVVRLPQAAWHGAASHRERLAEALQATPLPAEDTDPSLRAAVTAFLDSPATEHRTP
jgi:CDI immunity proteins